MTDLAAVISKAVTTVPECLAAGVVDVASGLLLDIKTVDSHPSAVIDLLAAATSDLFQGPNVTAIETMFKKSRGVDSVEHYFEEIFITSKNLLHVFLRGRRNADYVICFVCRKTVNLGMALTKARACAPEIEMAI
ncbi:hypothetical protein [Acidocella sp. KAb 2-4]|uniref:hypothetical protein n=1 Tax=Acidocella sp. KAb 2-4 TaxID=2885158 RepID=UPI001D063861|nr:hypothetical protein [Acidocella sp. KAb 2-4]MCB5944479.1 hypothetical protein [Acidocella sp. KAb 2-4]